MKLMTALLVFFSVVACADGTKPVPVCSVQQGPPCYDTSEKLTLIGGEIADPKEWPNSIWIGNCSATVVGERVVASAAHCMRNGATISFTKGASRYSAKCTHHPDYRGNSTADWALCAVSQVVEGGEYEHLNTNPSLVKVGTTLTNSGYGCRKWGGGLDGKFRIGNAPVIRIPSNKNYDIVTRGNVALCSGDSGGASFIRQQFGYRYVVAVNSRSNTTTTSYMPAWHLPVAIEWGKRWAESQGLRICGYHMDAKACRMAIPPLPNKTEQENDFAKAVVELKPGYEFKLERAKALLTDLMEKVGL